VAANEERPGEPPPWHFQSIAQQGLAVRPGTDRTIVAVAGFAAIGVTSRPSEVP
jgi:hypothetical protein